MPHSSSPLQHSRRSQFRPMTVLPGSASRRNVRGRLFLPPRSGGSAERSEAKGGYGIEYCIFVTKYIRRFDMSEMDTFIRQIRSRSTEHTKAMGLLSKAQLAGQMVSLLRQELDSLVRVIYLLSLPVERRAHLISSSVNGKKWCVTDREMVDLSQKLIGWTQSVYKFGCAFIHLSSFHDYANRDPLKQLPLNEQKDIIQHCRHYHGGPMSEEPMFADLVSYLPRVLEKIAGNLEYYVEKLETEQGLDSEEKT